MPHQVHSEFISGWKFRLLELKMLRRLARIAFSIYPRRSDAWQALRRHIAVHLEYKRICHVTKAVRVGERIFVQMTFPYLESKSMNVLAVNELSRSVSISGNNAGLNTLLLAITKKCSLQCAHCCEWDALNGREQLSADDLMSIVRKFQAHGVASIELSGGEPLNRFDDLLQLLRGSDTERTDFWVLSSGYRLTQARAHALREAGLVGISISLDHWDPAEHDRFRGLQGSFEWAKQAVQHAKSAGLAVCLTLTTLREFCTPGHLWRYAEMARDWGVHFIRLMEPRAVGHFAGKEVELRPQETAVLEDFFREIQRGPAYRDFPLLEYYAAYIRQKGCSGAGKRFLYVDTDGDMHACGFCHNKCGNALKNSIESGIENMERASGCHAYVTD